MESTLDWRQAIVCQRNHRSPVGPLIGWAPRVCCGWNRQLHEPVSIERQIHGVLVTRERVDAIDASRVPHSRSQFSTDAKKRAEPGGLCGFGLPISFRW